MKYNNKLPDDKVNFSQSSALWDLTWMLSGVFVTIVTIYFLLGYIVKFGVEHISVKNEQILFHFLQSKQTKKKSKEELYLQKLVDNAKKCIKSSYNFNVQIINSNDINAFAIPGGNIFVTQKLIKTATSQNEIFFVLAHEIGHFHNRDHLKGIGRSFVFNSIAFLTGLTDMAGLLNESLSFSESRFSQEQESQADIFAVELMNCYYGHVNGATDFFKTLPKDKNYNLFASHPKTKNRIKTIEQYIEEKHFHIKNKIPYI